MAVLTTELERMSQNLFDIEPDGNGKSQHSTLAPWQTYRENTQTFLERQSMLKAMYSQQQQHRTPTSKSRWSSSSEISLPSSRQSTFCSSQKASVNTYQSWKTSPRLLKESTAPADMDNFNNDATHRNVALIPILPPRMTTSAWNPEWTANDYICISPRSYSNPAGDYANFADWASENVRNICPRETHRAHTEFPPITRQMRQQTLLDVPLATSPRRGMLEITVPQLSRERMIQVGRFQEGVITQSFSAPQKFDRQPARDLQRPINLSQLDPSLTFADVGFAASTFCDRKMKYVYQRPKGIDAAVTN